MLVQAVVGLHLALEAVGRGVKWDQHVGRRAVPAAPGSQPLALAAVLLLATGVAARALP